MIQTADEVSSALPASPASCEAGVPRAPSDCPLVLAVDDDPGGLRAIEATLGRVGYRVRCARGGEEALAEAQAAPPDLILLDLMMPPGIDGYETIRRLRANPRFDGIPIIVLSSMQDTTDRVRALTLGAVDFVCKPFRSEEILARLRTHLTIRRLQRDSTARNLELETANRRMKADLDAASRVQRALLPTIGPPCTGYEVAWASRPCFEVGGDSLDVFAVTPDTLAFYLLDVSGHGVSSCLLATSVTRSLTPRTDRSSLVVEPGWNGTERSAVAPGEVLRRLNTINLMDPERNPHFITMVYGLMHLPTGRVRWANAGHPVPVVVRANGAVETSGTSSMPIGVLPETRFEESEQTLAPGDQLMLYSDGAWEQRNELGHGFGPERLRSVLSQRHAPLNEIVQRVATEVELWAGSTGLTDDLSVFGIRRNSHDELRCDSRGFIGQTCANGSNPCASNTGGSRHL